MSIHPVRFPVSSPASVSNANMARHGFIEIQLTSQIYAEKSKNSLVLHLQKPQTYRNISNVHTENLQMISRYTKQTDLVILH